MTENPRDTIVPEPGDEHDPSKGLDMLRSKDLEQPIDVQLPDKTASIGEIAESIADLPPKKFIILLQEITRRGLSDQLRGIVDVFEIMATKSGFDDPEKVKILEEAAPEYGFSCWIKSQEGKSLRSATRNDLQDWWDFYTQMTAMRGYNPGSIDQQNRETNLWKATANLARKMSKDPAIYMYLPPYLINNPQQVEKVLSEINDPIAFIEILTGEAWEDLQKSEGFLSAFSTQENTGAEGAVASVMLALQRSQQ